MLNVIKEFTKTLEKNVNMKTRRWHVTISCQPDKRPRRALCIRRTRTRTFCIQRTLSRHVTIGTPAVIFAVFTVFDCF